MQQDILVIGDSHAAVFASAPMAAAFPDCRFEVLAVGGATVSGLPNPNAETRAMQQYLAALVATRARTVIVMLGEVDTGFVIWWRAQKHGTPVAEMRDLALASYRKLLLGIAGSFRVVCVSTPLPTIRDGTDWGPVANLRREVTATQRERTALTLDFNREMAAFCAASGIDHLMLDDASLGTDGLLRDELRHPNPADHHYDPARHTALIAPLLRAVLAREGQPA